MSKSRATIYVGVFAEARAAPWSAGPHASSRARHSARCRMLPPMTPEQRALVIQFFDTQIPFNRLLGLSVRELGEGRAIIDVPFRADLIGDPTRPALHGGVLSATIDAAGGAAAFTQVSLPHDRISTIDLRVDYLRPAELRDFVCEGTVSRMGNRVASVDIVAYHAGESDRLIATGKAVYSIRRSDQ